MERNDLVLAWGVGKGEKDRKGQRRGGGCPRWAKSRDGVGERHGRSAFVESSQQRKSGQKVFCPVLTVLWAHVSVWLGRAEASESLGPGALILGSGHLGGGPGLPGFAGRASGIAHDRSQTAWG